MSFGIEPFVKHGAFLEGSASRVCPSAEVLCFLVVGIVVFCCNGVHLLYDCKTQQVQ